MYLLSKTFEKWMETLLSVPEDDPEGSTEYSFSVSLILDDEIFENT